MFAERPTSIVVDAAEDLAIDRVHSQQSSPCRYRRRPVRERLDKHRAFLGLANPPWLDVNWRQQPRGFLPAGRSCGIPRPRSHVQNATRPDCRSRKVAPDVPARLIRAVAVHTDRRGIHSHGAGTVARPTRDGCSLPSPGRSSPQTGPERRARDRSINHVEAPSAVDAVAADVASNGGCRLFLNVLSGAGAAN